MLNENNPGVVIEIQMVKYIMRGAFPDWTDWSTYGTYGKRNWEDIRPTPATWTPEQVRDHFSKVKGLEEFGEFFFKEEVDGVGLLDILKNKKDFDRHLVRKSKDITWGQRQRLFREIEELSKHDRYFVVAYSPRMMEASEVKAMFDKEKVFQISVKHNFNYNSGYSLGYGGGAYGQAGKNFFAWRQVDIRFPKLEFYETTSSQTVNGAFLCFSGYTMCIHETKNPTSDGNILQVPGVSTIYSSGGYEKVIEWDGLNGSNWSFKTHMAYPHHVRLAIKELLLIREFRKNHPISRFDTNLLLYFFNFLLPDDNQCLSPIKPNVHAYRNVIEARERNIKIKRGGNFDNDSLGQISLDNKCDMKGALVVGKYSCLLQAVNQNTGQMQFFIIQLVNYGTKYHVWNRWGQTGQEGEKETKDVKDLAEGKHAFAEQFRKKTDNIWNPNIEQSFVTKPGLYYMLSYDPTGKDMGFADHEVDELGAGFDNGF